MAIYPEQSGKIEYDFDIGQLAAQSIIPLRGVTEMLNAKLRAVFSIEEPLSLRVEQSLVAGNSGHQSRWKVTLTVVRKDSGEMWDHKSRQLINEFESAANEALGFALF